MSQRSLFFDSINADRPYSAADYAALIGALVKKDGVVYGYKNALVVSPTSPESMGVQVGMGAAFVGGYMLEVHDAAETLILSPADATNPRIDRVVVRLNLAQAGRVASLAVKEGTPAASPTVPILQQYVTVWEISLAQIAVGAGVTTITAANITDERSYVSHEHNGTDMPKVDSANVDYVSGVTGFTSVTAAAALDALAGARIVERGSNANGDYVRWEDGWQECLGTHALPNGSLNTTITYPAAFSAAPRVYSTPNFGGAVSGVNPSNPGVGTCVMRYGASSAPGDNVPFFWRAIGRWK